MRQAPSGIGVTALCSIPAGLVMTGTMEDQIEVYCDSYGVWYCSTKERLINAGIATETMFPTDAEAWRGNGSCREPNEPLWSIQRAAGNRFKVKWGLCIEAKAE